jgi:hypothetical protein
MARLYDRAMVGVDRYPLGHIDDQKKREAWDDVSATEIARVRSAEVVIVADEVAQYVAEHGPPDVSAIQVSLPFSQFWIEYRLAQKLLSGGVRHDHVGCLFSVRDHGEDAEGVRWEASVAIFRAVGRKGPVRGVEYIVMLDVDQLGRVSLDNYDAVSPGIDAWVSMPTSSGAFAPALMALGLLGCKNVRRREQAQPPKLSKKWEKKHGRPLVRYHVLDIDPMRKVLRDEGGSEETGLKKALHICRGHFATYTDEAPLFGRVTGTFWKPQHIRGSKKQGLVLKDYNVKAPR